MSYRTVKLNDVRFDCGHVHDEELIPDLLQCFDCRDKQSLYAMFNEALVWADRVGLTFCTPHEPFGSSAEVGRPMEEEARFEVTVRSQTGGQTKCLAFLMLLRAAVAALFMTNPALRRAAEAQRDEVFPAHWFPDPEPDYYLDNNLRTLEVPDSSV